MTLPALGVRAGPGTPALASLPPSVPPDRYGREPGDAAPRRAGHGAAAGPPIGYTRASSELAALPMRSSAFSMFSIELA
jgi:hypothetical protein